MDFFDVFGALGWTTSTTWRRRSASVSSSRVARKAATRIAGSFWMKPTVSVRRTGPMGSCASVG